MELPQFIIQLIGKLTAENAMYEEEIKELRKQVEELKKISEEKDD